MKLSNLKPMARDKFVMIRTTTDKFFVLLINNKLRLGFSIGDSRIHVRENKYIANTVDFGEVEVEKYKINDVDFYLQPLNRTGLQIPGHNYDNREIVLNFDEQNVLFRINKDKIEHEILN